LVYAFAIEFFPADYADYAEFTEYYCCNYILKFDIAIEIVIFLPQIARIGTDALRLTQIRTDFIGLCFCD